MLSVSELTKQVPTHSGELTILNDISFSVSEGESVAIVGASGSGKSTLLSLMAGLDTPSSGKVILSDENITDLDEDQRADFRARNVGFVFQSFHLLSTLTALENVALPLELKGGKKVSKKAAELLERVGLGDRLDHYPKQMSGGEQQRVAIARAFAAEPAILFADEPTGNLDTETGQKIIDILFEMNRSKGTTLILVTHDLKLAERCDRQLELSSGKLVSDNQAKQSSGQPSGQSDRQTKQQSDNASDSEASHA
ncbi:ABC transporter ATP-binding protein [Pleionea mediterranea]|uniref:Putative ABC transport system ATP-binding protein n=1 Tax=Pleionea mediterranea TaxID=523701 RepID=A0A316F6D1_9GAMM|nr:ABC transporter ATP-binding protein [Pleionea mediterranea]PWK41907.1 putative ABC transport system ATP-binding protein [Pleionea mediterranea]